MNGSSGVESLRFHQRRLPQPRASDLLRRTAKMALVTGRHLAPLALRQARHSRQGLLPATSLARPLRLSFEELGGTFIKFGQMIASAPGLFGEHVAEEFRSCLDTGPVVPFADVKRRVEEDLGCTLDEAFSHFDPHPIGRASIAVVYQARLLNGREVAVKVLRPGVEHLVATDLDLMQPWIDLVARQTGDQVAGSMVQLLDGLRTQVGEELDLRNERRALQHFRSLARQVALPSLVVPEPCPDLSGPNVLTMELFHGVPVDDLAQVAELGLDPAPLIQDVIRAFFTTTVRWGAFHGDLHAGNMLLLEDGRLGIIDWGIVGRLDDATHHFFIRLLEAVLGDEAAWSDVTAFLVRTYGPIIEEGLGLSGPSLTDFIRSLVEPTLMRPFGEVSLAALVEAPQVQAARAQGVEAHHRSIRSVMTRLRAQRRLRRLADETGFMASEFDRGTFLLGKQLMYFERYGKMFLADVPILTDRDFFVSVLEEAHGEPPRQGGDSVAASN